MSRWVVLVDAGPDRQTTHAYGPIEDQESAIRFAEFMTSEVDPAHCLKLVDPLDETLAYWRNHKPEPDPARPIGWPPSPGEVWEDRNGDRWICLHHAAYLVCIPHQADDSAEEIWRLFGPLHRIQLVAPTLSEEPPF